MKTIKLDYPGVKILSISKGWGFILQAVVIIAKDKKEKDERLDEFKKIQDEIQKQLVDQKWETVFHRTPKVYIYTESYFKKCKRWL